MSEYQTPNIMHEIIEIEGGTIILSYFRIDMTNREPIKNSFGYCWQRDYDGCEIESHILATYVFDIIKGHQSIVDTDGKRYKSYSTKKEAMSALKNIPKSKNRRIYY